MLIILLGIYLAVGLTVTYWSVTLIGRDGIDLKDLAKENMAKEGLIVSDGIIYMIVYLGVLLSIVAWPYILGSSIREAIKEGK